jgi:hypothetical protein
VAQAEAVLVPKLGHLRQRNREIILGAVREVSEVFEPPGAEPARVPAMELNVTDKSFRYHPGVPRPIRDPAKLAAVEEWIDGDLARGWLRPIRTGSAQVTSPIHVIPKRPTGYRIITDKRALNTVLDVENTAVNTVVTAIDTLQQ